MKDVKKVTILKDGKKIDVTKVEYSKFDEFCAEYRKTHTGDFKFKMELYRCRC